MFNQRPLNYEPARTVTTTRLSSPSRRKEAVPAQTRTAAGSQRGLSPLTTQRLAAERYNKKSFSRQPSPGVRTQRPGSANEVPTPRSATLRSTLDVAYKRAKTAEYRKPEKPNYDNKLFITVKEVLRKAVTENGKIDQENIDNIMHEIQTRLQEFEKNSRTTDDLNTPTEHLTSLRKHQGVRKEINVPSRKVRGQVNLPHENNKIGKDLLEEGEETIFIDLPDSDYSNFNSMLKKQNTKPKEHNVINMSTQENVPSSVQEDIQTPEEEKVGDCESKMDKWNLPDDIKLQNYIESLIKNINNQLHEHQTEEVESDLKEKSFCKSICVCKVCVSNHPFPKLNTSSRKMSTHSEVKAKQSSSNIKNNIKCGDLSVKSSTANTVKFIDKGSNTESPAQKMKVLKRNQNFQKESCVTISPNVPAPEHPSTIEMPLCNDEEAREEMYLQKRINRAPIRRRISPRT